MFKAKCMNDCTTPTHGKVVEGVFVQFDIETWDRQKYPYLKHFRQVATTPKAIQQAREEGRVSQQEKHNLRAPRPEGTEGSPSAPVTTEDDNPAPKFSAMGVEELNKYTPQQVYDAIYENYGKELDINLDHADIIMAAIEAEEAGAEPSEPAEDVFE